MPSAGDITNASDVTTRIATATLNANSGTWTTTESAALLTVTGSLVNGQRYSLTLFTNIATSSAAAPSVEVSLMRIREDTASGTQNTGVDFWIASTTGAGFGLMAYSEYTAVATGTKSFVLTGQRIAGAGSHSIAAGTSRQTFLNIDLVSS
jgi:hypothetical protein